MSSNGSVHFVAVLIVSTSLRRGGRPGAHGRESGQLGDRSRPPRAAALQGGAYGRVVAHARADLGRLDAVSVIHRFLDLIADELSLWMII
jgi:hypothetical protein